MRIPEFRPGFRLSLFDLAVLCAGGIGAVVSGLRFPWAGVIVVFVVLHFFLFCNVFRISRRPELIWAGVFVVLSGATMISGYPGWITSLVLAATLSTFLIWRETRRVDYHGICWERWNPRLPEWWRAAHESKAE